MFVETYEVVRLQTCFIQVKRYHPISLQAFIPTITERHTTNCVFQAIKDLARDLDSLELTHGNLNATNVFVENLGSKDHFRAKLLLSDPHFTQSEGQNDALGLANLMHLLVCGL